MIKLLFLKGLIRREGWNYTPESDGSILITYSSYVLIYYLKKKYAPYLGAVLPLNPQKLQLIFMILILWRLKIYFSTYSKVNVFSSDSQTVFCITFIFLMLFEA